MKSFQELAEFEGNAQKWAIDKAIKLGLSEVARCLLGEFMSWGLEGYNPGQIDSDITPFLEHGNPYSYAAMDNEEWIANKWEKIV